MQLGYIKIEDFIELVRLADKVIMETEHYVYIEYGPSSVDVYVMKDGLHRNKDYDLVERFVMYDPWAPKRDAEKFCTARDYLKSLLGREENE
jgi:hypothetical protein